MVYGAKIFNNGKVVGYLRFSTGKIVYLNVKEKIEFDQKIKDWEWIAIERQK